ncbi:MAG TPA: hypothetical protein PLU18_04015 [Ferruginibacter sp.]|nr:hypothetical protein [Ferruginibacter sp.]HRB22575.1 hypothetical protein [Ferruginibacter sp.]
MTPVPHQWNIVLNLISLCVWIIVQQCTNVQVSDTTTAAFFTYAG